MDKNLLLLHQKTALRNKHGYNLVLPGTNPYIAAATSDNTRKAYQSDIRHFEKWGGVLPTNTDMVLKYLQAYAASLNPRTLARRLIAIKNWHIYQSFADPTEHPVVSKTLTGIMRLHGKPKEKAPPLLPEDLLKIVTYLNEKQTLHAARDNALLQLAFFGAFRGSEIVALCYEHIKWQEEGIDILVPHSKTDQMNEGRYCAIPYGNEQLCPVRALKAWLEKGNIQSGFIFRRIYRDNRLGTMPLVPLSVSNILRTCAKEIGLANACDFSSHSLRRGLATAASREGASLSAIMRQGRWKNVNTVMEYIEAAQRFEENAAKDVLKNINLL